MAHSSDAYRRPWEEVVQEQNVSPESGLSSAEAKRRLAQYGPNELREKGPVSPWRILIHQFKGLVVVLLVAAAGVSIYLRDWPEAIAIGVVILINAGIGFFTEYKAVRSVEALKKMGSVTTRVRRDGELHEVPAADLVPGDIVLIEGGDIVTADMRLVKASKLQVDESALTGESVPVSKSVEPADEEKPLAERAAMLYRGTAVTRGSAVAVVVGTGMETELGGISTLVEQAQEAATPLEKRLDALAQRLVWVVLGIVVVVAGLGVMRGNDVWQMVETAIALAVASIPEGLPIVATIALSRGVMRMARHQALVRRLASVETLGSTNVICTDKTGTLTENRMTVQRVDTAAGAVERNERGGYGGEGEEASEPFREAVRIGVLCNNASVTTDAERSDAEIGDPLEVALLNAGLEVGLDQAALVQEAPEVREVAFESDSKMMATYHRQNGGVYVAVKGAPEQVLGACTRVLTPRGEEELTEERRAEWERKNEELGREGFRVLAVARKQADTADAEPYRDLVLVGLLSLVDPPRMDIRPTIEQCHRAGIRIVMVTGDQAPTAVNIAEAVGIVEDGTVEAVLGQDLKPPEALSDAEEDRLRDTMVFARVTPKQKLDLIALHQAKGAIVAMTGDGVNDAPALKKADIGVAMGQRGTQVAREVADVVLRNDSFETIVEAIHEGRVIFGNIRKFVIFLISCNVAEVLVIFLATLLGTVLPITPLQILFLNLVTDVFPALALGVGEGEAGVMDRPPRPTGEPIVTRRHWLEISFYGLLLGAATLGAFLFARFSWRLDVPESITIAFLTLAFSQLWHTYNMRGPGAPLLSNEITRNLYVWGALALCSALLLAAVYVPVFRDVLDTTPLGWRSWSLVLGASLAPVVVDIIARRFYRPAPR